MAGLKTMPAQFPTTTFEAQTRHLIFEMAHKIYAPFLHHCFVMIVSKKNWAGRKLCQPSLFNNVYLFICPFLLSGGSCHLHHPVPSTLGQGLQKISAADDLHFRDLGYEPERICGWTALAQSAPQNNRSSLSKTVFRERLSRVNLKFYEYVQRRDSAIGPMVTKTHSVAPMGNSFTTYGKENPPHLKRVFIVHLY